jgi:hypothetical protein
LLDNLASRRYTSLGDLSHAASDAAQGPLVITRRVRGRALLAAGMAPLVLVLLAESYLWLPTVHPDWITLAGCLREYQRSFRDPTPDALRTREALLIHIPARYGRMIEEAKVWPLPRSLDTDPSIARAIVASNPRPAAFAAARAERVLVPFLAPYDRSLELLRYRITGAEWLLTARLFVLAWILVTIAGLAAILAVVTRGGIVLRGLRLAIVGPDGLEASRLRILGRSALVWVPLAALGVVLAPGFGEAAETIHTLWNNPGLVFFGQVLYVAAARGSFVMSTTVWLWVVWIGVVLLVTGLVAALVNPQRGLNDRIAGTRLVPR